MTFPGPCDIDESTSTSMGLKALNRSVDRVLDTQYIIFKY